MAQGAGIYLTEKSLRWVIAEVRRGVPRVLQAGTAPREKGISDEVRETFPPDVAVCTVPDGSFFHPLSFPFSSRRRVLSVLKHDIEGRSIDPIDSFTADFYPVQEGESGVRGIGVTFPKDLLRECVEAPGGGRDPLLVTLDMFAVLKLLSACRPGEGDFFLAGFTEKTVTMGEVSGGVFTRIRSIPASVRTAQEAVEAVEELLKRFDRRPEGGMLKVFCSGGELCDRLREEERFEIVSPDLVRRDGSGLSDAEILVPAAAAAAAVNPGGVPNFRWEEFAPRGAAALLAGHWMFLLGTAAVLFLVSILFLASYERGCVQEVHSLRVSAREEAERVLGKKELDDLLKGGAVSLDTALKKAYTEAASRAGEEDADLPPSAYRVLQEIFACIPEGLDIAWTRIIVREKIISLTGELPGSGEETSRGYDAFVANLRNTGKFTVRLAHVRGSTFRITLSLER